MAGLDESFAADPAVADEDFRGGPLCSSLECADNGRLAPVRTGNGSLGRHCEALRVREAERAALWSERIATSCILRVG